MRAHLLAACLLAGCSINYSPDKAPYRGASTAGGATSSGSTASSSGTTEGAGSTGSSSGATSSGAGSTGSSSSSTSGASSSSGGSSSGSTGSTGSTGSASASSSSGGSSTGSSGAPGPVSNLAVLRVGIAGSVRWMPPPGPVTGYQVRALLPDAGPTGDGGPAALVGPGDGGPMMANLFGLSLGSRYAFLVHALNGGLVGPDRIVYPADGLLVPLAQDDLGGSASTYDLAKGDLNADGHTDLVLGCGNAEICVRLGLPDGGLGAGARLGYPDSTDNEGLLMADVNGDGHPDLLISLDGDATASLLGVHLGLPDGGLEPPAPDGGAPHAFPVSHGAGRVAARDLDGDGLLDVVVVGHAGAPADPVVLAGLPDAGFLESRTLTGSGPATGAYLANLDKDGGDELVCSVEGAADGIDVWLNDGGFSFLGPSHLSNGAAQTIVADLNGDGWPDLVTSDYGADLAEVRLNDQHGGFGAPITGPCHFAWTVSSSDVNADGYNDVICGGSAPARLSVLLFDGTSLQDGGVYSPAGDPSATVLGDFNGDGHTDVAVAEQTGVQLFLGQ